MHNSIKAVLILLVCHLSYAQELNLSLLSQSAPSNIYNAMVIDDTLLFCCQDDFGIFDISDPVNPKLIKILPISMNPYNSSDGGCDIVKNGNYVYFSFGNGFIALEDSLCVVNVSNAHNPCIEEKMTLGNEAFVTDLEVWDDFLFICCQLGTHSYLKIYDISEGLPEFVTEIYFEYCYSYVEVFDDFVAVDSGSLPDVTFYNWDGTSLDSLSSVENLNDLYDIYYHNGYLYGGCSANLSIIRAPQIPFGPFLAANPSLPGDNSSLAAHFGNLLFTSGWNMHLIDISEPLNPVIAYAMSSDNEAFFEQYVNQQYLYTFVTHFTERLKLMVYDISDIYQPDLVNELYIGTTCDVDVCQQRYALLSQYNSLKVFDALDPQNPVLINELLIGKNIHNIAVSNNSAYVFMQNISGYCYFRLVDFSIPLQPIIGDSIYFPQLNYTNSKLSVINDSTMYLFDGDWFIFDIDASGLSLVDSVISENYIYDDFYKSDSITVAYAKVGTVEDKANLFFDYGDRNPTYITTIETNIRIKSCIIVDQYLAISVGDDYLYEETGLVEIYDISDPYHPYLVQTHEVPNYITFMEADSQYIYMLDYLAVKAFNRNALPTLEMIDSLYFGDFCEGLFVSDSILYAAGNMGGLYIIGNGSQSEINNNPFNRASNTYTLSSAFPNPFNLECTISFQIPRTEKVKIAVYNVLGQRVAVLADAVYSAGNHSVVWNGRNSGGGNLSSGIYFYQIQAGEFVRTQKMALLK